MTWFKWNCCIFLCALFVPLFFTWVRLKAMALYIIMFGNFGMRWIWGFGHYSFVHLTLLVLLLVGNEGLDLGESSGYIYEILWTSLQPKMDLVLHRSIDPRG